jgi:trehalose 2-sulfotransferase
MHLRNPRLVGYPRLHMAGRRSLRRAGADGRGRVEHVVAIAATPRSGSTLLAEALGATGVLGRPDEYLHLARLVRHWEIWGTPQITFRTWSSRALRAIDGDWDWRRTARVRPASLPRYLEVLAERRSSDNKVFAIKLMWHHYAERMLDNGHDISFWGAPVTWLRIDRHDRVRQAISLVRAEQTRQFRSDRPAVGTPSYDGAAIAAAIARLDGMAASWDAHFRSLGIEPFRISYEDLEDRYADTMRSVLAHLGQPDAPVVPAPLRRQADVSTEQWVERFLAETSRRDAAAR